MYNIYKYIYLLFILKQVSAFADLGGNGDWGIGNGGKRYRVLSHPVGFLR